VKHRRGEVWERATLCKNSITLHRPTEPPRYRAVRINFEMRCWYQPG
jgi:hypothetical protein